MAVQTLRDIWIGLTDEQRTRVRRWVRRNRLALDDEPVDVSQVPVAFQWLAVQLVENQAGDNASVLGPCCNRESALDGLVDIRPVPLATREDYLSRAGIPNPSAPFLCGACRGRLFRSGVVEKWRFVQALGGSPDLVDRYR